MTNFTRSSVFATAILFLALLAVWSVQYRAQHSHGAHGDGHTENHSWYLTLRQPRTGMSCCNNKDCRPTVSRVVGDVVQVEVDGEWTNVPPEKILNTPSPDLMSHVCAPKKAEQFPKGHVFCVVLGGGA